MLQYYGQKKKRTASSYGESQFQRAVVRYLRLSDIFCFSIPNGVHLTTIQSKIAVAEGLLHGVSDLIVLTPNKITFVEMKNPNGKGSQSENQKNFQKKIESLGFEYVIWDNWDKVERFVEKIKREQV